MPKSVNEYLVVEYLNSVDNIVIQPIQLTKRIHYTTYDVSSKFIIFGANSGGLYVFNRHPCTFVKLIPSKEGSITLVSISHDERVIGVATSKGTMYLVNNDTDENAARDNVIQISYEHQGHAITAMKWNDQSNEVYVGDNVGKISVVVVTSFITKTMLQTPITTLMHLDSQIVQLDFGSRFLLVSTLTRSYLCDTETEYYRQIGKKVRTGEYGACILGTKTPNTYTLTTERQIQSPFRILSEKESFVVYDGCENLKLFCARPGARLWEVQLNGNVVRTHQFKQALTIGPCNVIALASDQNCRLNFKTVTNENTNVNFGKVYVFLGKFILAYQTNGIYIFDPDKAQVLFWTNIYTNIIDVKIIHKHIYVRTSSNQIHILLFTTVEDFLMKSYLITKQYLLVADLCHVYQKHIKKLLSKSNKLYLLKNLDEKLLEFGDEDLSEKFKSISNLINEHSNTNKTVQAAQKLTSGIYVIDNTHFISNTLLKQEEMLENQKEEIKSNESKEDDKSKVFKSFYEQYELSKIDSRFPNYILDKLIENYSTSKLISMFIDFEAYCQKSKPENEDVRIWSSNKCFIYLNVRNDLNLSFYSPDLIQYLIQTFEFLNPGNSEQKCVCGYPLPQASKNECEFYNIGCALMEQNSEICHQVPYMWKHILKLKQNENPNSLIPLILQFGNFETFLTFSKFFTYDLWTDCLKKFIQLKQGHCLNCEHTFRNDDTCGLSWNQVALEMIKSIGGESAVCILLQLAEHIPKATLDIVVYQCGIFSTIVDNFNSKLRGEAVDFMRNNSKIEQFGMLLEKSLQHPKILNLSKDTIDINCTWCHMPLQTPVLSSGNYTKLLCGHYFHNICIENINRLCNICSTL